MPHSADAILELISRYLPQLWDTQRLSHSRCLRLVLITAEQYWNQGTTAEAVSGLISTYLPQLWEVQQRAGSRQLRTLLNAAERLREQSGPVRAVSHQPAPSAHQKDARPA